VSVASHLAVSPSGYDRRIRQLIPHYDDLVAEAARALRLAARPVRNIVDLGIGTGALTGACLRRAPAARVFAIDADAAMTQIANVRLRRWRRRVTIVRGDFLETPLPRTDAIVASYALHHIRTTRAKLAFYRRCREALRPGGVLINGDCAPASSAVAVAGDLEDWYAHLAPSTGSRRAARRTIESWADEDTYMTLAVEMRLLAQAGFIVEVPWRRSPFAVIAGVRPR
jgi:trans-aconitate methyltransferase